MAEATTEISESAPVTPVGIRAVLRNQQFRFLWLSQLLSATAGNMVTFVLVLELYARTGSSLLVSILIVLTVLPTILFSSLAGVYADTFNRKYLLISSNLVRSVLVVTLSFFPASPWLFLLFGFLLSSMSQFFGPAQSAAIPKLVNRHELFSANTLFMFTTYTSVLFGYTLAGPALHFLGDVRTASLLVVGFTLSAILNLRLPFFRDHLERQLGKSYVDRAFGNLATGIREGLLVVRDSRMVLLMLLLVSFLFGVERAIVGLLPNLAKNILHFSVDEISYFFIAPVGVGAIVAVIFGSRIVKRIKTFTLMLAGFLLSGIVLLPFPLIAAAHGRFVTVASTIIIAILSGIASIVVIVAGQTLLHERTPAETHGRVFGSLITIMNAVGLPIILFVGFLTDHLSPQSILFLIGAVLTAAGFGATAIARRSGAFVAP